MAATKRRMVSMEDAPDDGFIQPPDQDALLEARKVEVKESAVKAEEEGLELTSEEEDEAIDLINAGCKNVYFTLFRRKIHLRTLNIEEELKVSEITKPFIGSDGYPRAYRTAIVAAAIRTIDNELLFNPISELEFDQLIVKKFEKLLTYYPLAVDQIYARYRDMELELLSLVEKLGKSSG